MDDPAAVGRFAAAGGVQDEGGHEQDIARLAFAGEDLALGEFRDGRL